jgi:hypothetical protein
MARCDSALPLSQPSRHSLVAPLALTRLAQRWHIKKRSEFNPALLLRTAVRGVYFTPAGPMEDRS